RLPIEVRVEARKPVTQAKVPQVDSGPSTASPRLQRRHPLRWNRRRQPPCSARRAMLFVPALAQFEISGALN
ncbi:hypothetical protein AK812_SmicGene45825, partial [Symbiodinium microadriaticum]